MGLKSNLHNLKLKYQGTKMAPAFNAIHTFLYLPNETTHGGTHIKAADDLKTYDEYCNYGFSAMFNIWYF